MGECDRREKRQWESVIRVCLYDGDEFGGERRDVRWALTLEPPTAQK